MNLHELGKESVQGGLILFVGQGFSTILLAITSILTARFLGPDAFGIYILTLLIPTLISALIDFGISPALTWILARSYSANQQKPSETLQVGLLSKALVSCLLALVCYLLAEFFAVVVLRARCISDSLSLLFILPGMNTHRSVYYDARARALCIKLIRNNNI
jgi:O-antigen/teichoic acid export membrane protein